MLREGLCRARIKWALTDDCVVRLEASGAYAAPQPERYKDLDDFSELPWWWTTDRQNLISALESLRMLPKLRRYYESHGFCVEPPYGDPYVVFMKRLLKQ